MTDGRVAATSRQDILVTIRQAAGEVLGENVPEITHDATLGDDGLGIDSLDLVEIAMEIETQLDISFASDELSDIHSIEVLITVILDKVQAAPR